MNPWKSAQWPLGEEFVAVKKFLTSVEDVSLFCSRILLKLLGYHHQLKSVKKRNLFSSVQ